VSAAELDGREVHAEHLQPVPGQLTGGRYPRSGEDPPHDNRGLPVARQRVLAFAATAKVAIIRLFPGKRSMASSYGDLTSDCQILEQSEDAYG
jgi:hypothetical protein